MPLITDYLPDAPTILELDREELACLLLKYLKALPEGEQAQLNRHNSLSSYTVSRFSPDFQQQLLDALSEAWHWLETEGVIADKPGNRSGFVYITARAEKLKSTADLDALRKLLPYPSLFVGEALSPGLDHEGAPGEDLVEREGHCARIRRSPKG
jgi:hypothetical protein